MKRIIVTSIMLLISATMIFIHCQKVMALDKVIDESYNQIIDAYNNDNFEIIDNKLHDIKDEWDKVQDWAGMTVNAADLEEIDISLSQSIQYAKINAKEDFIGEFILFNHLIKHLPYFESFTMDSIL